MNICVRRPSGNPVKVAELGTSDKLSPLILCKFPEWPLGPISIADYDELPVLRNFNTLAAFTEARDVPVKTVRGRHISCHEYPFEVLTVRELRRAEPNRQRRFPASR
jgi:hypothetical protein